MIPQTQTSSGQWPRRMIQNHQCEVFAKIVIISDICLCYCGLTTLVLIIVEILIHRNNSSLKGHQQGHLSMAAPLQIEICNVTFFLFWANFGMLAIASTIVERFTTLLTFIGMITRMNIHVLFQRATFEFLLTN